MCTCRQKSKKPAGSPGNSNYIFSCTDDGGTVSDIKITAGNDNEAKALAELECVGNKAAIDIHNIISDYYSDNLVVVLNPTFSNSNLLIVAFAGVDRWIGLPTKTLEKVEKAGYSLYDKELYPLIQIFFKDAFSKFRDNFQLLELRLRANDPTLDLPTLSDLTLYERRKEYDIDNRVKELSGKQWVARFPGSSSISDLVSPFRENVENFISALDTASATTIISATLRPTERAYLMRTAFDIANELISPEDASVLNGVNIEWVHETSEKSIKAAKEMVAGYGIVYQPAYPTKHSEGTAIDMNLSCAGTLKIENAKGTEVSISSSPRTQANTELHQVAKTYGVIKLVVDPPHWSDNGH